MGAPANLRRKFRKALSAAEPIPIELEGRYYVPLAQVEDDDASFVCLLMSESAMPLAFYVVTFGGNRITWCKRKANDEPLRVIHARPLPMRVLLNVTLGFYVEPADDASDEAVMEALLHSANTVIETVQGAGLFCGAEAHAKIMEFGITAQHDNDGDWASKRLRVLSANCTPDNPRGMRDFAAILVVGSIMEMLPD